MAFEKGSEEFLEIENPEVAMFGGKDFQFSHGQLVFMAYTKVVNALSQEMVEGFWETKDDKLGNKFFIYHKDSRREAIETVKTLKNVMIADLNNNTNGSSEKLNKLFQKEINEKTKFLSLQKQWWENLNVLAQKGFIKENPSFHVSYLTDKSPFYHQYLYEILGIYREIFEQLELAISDSKYFKREMVRG